MESVLAGEGNPCFCARDFRKDVGFCQRFEEAGNRFTGKDIGACFRQNVDSFSVEIGEFFSRLAIVPSVFRAVSKVSAVRTDGGSGQGCRAVFFFMGEEVFIPGILHESDGALDEGCRFFLGEPLLLESVDGRLVARARHDVGACFVVGQMDSFDELRVLVKSNGAPEFIIDGKALFFELGGKSAVQDDEWIFLQNFSNHGFLLISKVQPAVHGRTISCR